MFEDRSLEFSFLAPLGSMARLKTRRPTIVQPFSTRRLVYNDWFNTAQILLEVLVSISVIGLDLRQ